MNKRSITLGVLALAIAFSAVGGLWGISLLQKVSNLPALGTFEPGVSPIAVPAVAATVVDPSTIVIPSLPLGCESIEVPASFPDMVEYNLFRAVARRVREDCGNVLAKKWLTDIEKNLYGELKAADRALYFELLESERFEVELAVYDRLEAAPAIVKLRAALHAGHNNYTEGLVRTHTWLKATHDKAHAVMVATVKK